MVSSGLRKTRSPLPSVFRRKTSNTLLSLFMTIQIINLAKKKQNFNGCSEKKLCKRSSIKFIDWGVQVPQTGLPFGMGATSTFLASNLFQRRYFSLFSPPLWQQSFRFFRVLITNLATTFEHLVLLLVSLRLMRGETCCSWGPPRAFFRMLRERECHLKFFRDREFGWC